MNAHAKVTSKGQITLPAKLRKAMNIKPGDHVEFRETADGTYELVSPENEPSRLHGFFKTDKTLPLEDIDDAIAAAVRPQ